MYHIAMYLHTIVQFLVPFHQFSAYVYINKTRYTHSVNASCSYKVQEDIIYIHMNSLLEDVALL